MDICVPRAGGTWTNPRSTGPREALCGLIPDSHWERHTYGYAYWLDSGATPRPRVPFPKSTSREPANPGGLQTEKWPKKERNERRSRVEQADDGPCTSAELISPLREDWSESLSTPPPSRYVQKASLPDISHIAALFIGQSTATWDCPPAAKRKH